MINTELSFLEFYNTKKDLEAGYYRVIEHDGSESIAKICSDGWFRSVVWLSDDQYIEQIRQEDSERFWDRNMDAMDEYYDEQQAFCHSGV